MPDANSPKKPVRKPPSAQVTAMQPAEMPMDLPRPQHKALAVGTLLGKYRIISLLGRGGMGNVYAAEDPLIKRRVAIKVLAPELARDEHLIQRLLAEAQAAGNLNHPNVVTIYSVDKHNDTYFIVMELITGGNVEDYLSRRGSPGWRAATRLTAEAAKALGAAHERGLIHRDIKPSNLMLTQDGHVKVADFGLAKVESPDKIAQTQAGTILGTPAFMSPEQCRGDAIDARSDLYSLGCTYYMMLTGKQPYEAVTSMQVMFAHCSAPIPDPRALGGDIPDECAEILSKCLAKNPSDRYATAKELLADLRAVLGGQTLSGSSPLAGMEALSAHEPVMAAPVDYAPPARKNSAQIWIALSVMAAVILIGLGSLIVGRSGSSTSSAPVATPTNSPAPLVIPQQSPTATLVPAPQETPALVTPPVSAPPVVAPAVALVDPNPPKTEPAVIEPKPEEIKPIEPKPVETKTEEPKPVEPPPAVAVVEPKPEPPKPEPVKPEPPKLDLPKEVTNSIGQRLILLPTGKFMMGDKSLADAPPHEVTISKQIYMSAHEVTQGQISKVMGQAGMPRMMRESHPAAPINYDDAVEFCRKLSEDPAEKSAGRTYRLPTEAEWEYACRAGTKTKYAFGDAINTDRANFGKKIDLNNLRTMEDRRGTEPRPRPERRPGGPGNPQQPNDPPAPPDRSQRPLEDVGQYPANAWGFYDMHGSVWEWCSDFYSPTAYKLANVLDPIGPETGKTHVVRGGAWSSPSAQCTSAYRKGDFQFQPRDPSIGFRVVCEVRQ